MKFNMLGEYVLTDGERLDQLRTYYDCQRLESKKQEYLCECALKNLLNEISHVTYIYMFIDYKTARNELSSKKKNKPNIETLKNMIAADFFNGDSNFEITKIISCGLDSYGWDVSICKDNHNVSFFFPMRDKINEEDYESMLYGKIGFYEWKDERSRNFIYSDYDIAKIADTVNNYFDKI